jgi:hypothetical protein
MKMKPDWAERIQRGRKRAYEEGVLAERERITKLALNWIDEYEGHDSECDCWIKALGLQQFIDHEEFKGEQE